MGERAVRLVLDNQGQDEFRWSAIRSISTRIGCAPQTLNGWIKRPEVDSGKRAGSPSELAEKLKAVERAVRALRQGEEDQVKVRGTFTPTNAVLRKASAYFALAEPGRPLKR